MTSSPQPRFRIITKPRVQRQLARLGKKDYLHVTETIRDLADDPQPHGVLRLRTREHRVRWGNWRIFYTVDNQQSLVVITDVLRRNERTYRDR